jgi:peptide deformylase
LFFHSYLPNPVSELARKKTGDQEGCLSVKTQHPYSF